MFLSDLMNSRFGLINNPITEAACRKNRDELILKNLHINGSLVAF